MKEKEFIKKVIDDNIADKESIRTRAKVYGKEKKKSKNFAMRKGWAIALVVIIVLTGAFTAMASIYIPQKSQGIQPFAANAYSDVYKAMKKYDRMSTSFNFSDVFSMFKKAYAPIEMSNDASENFVNVDYSKTNIQTEGMDEGDIVKTDGNYIYKINTNGCVIVAADNGNLNVVSQIHIENYVPKEIYVKGNLLIMIGGVYTTFQPQQGLGLIEPMMDCISYVSYSTTDIRIYDISEKVSPKLKRQVMVEGNFETSRIMEEENKLFYMINYSFYSGQDDNSIPKIKDSAVSDKARNIPAENIYIYDDISNYSYMIIGHIELDQPQNQSEIFAYLGLGGEIYVSKQNIFVATYDWNSAYDRNVFGWVKESSKREATTRIVKIGLDNLRQKAATRVIGSIKDRYSMDEHNGFLRIATTVVSGEIFSNVYVLNSNLTIVGKIEGIAPGESIYAVRFNKDEGSLVTFRNIDPYFYLDLSDPYNPVIIGELKEDGVSYYIHYIEGTDYTIGIGMMSEVVRTPYGGEFVQWTGLKVSLYNNATGTPENISTYVIRGSCHADVLYDPKALLYDKDRGLIAFAYEKWNYEEMGYYYNTMTQGFAVFKFDLTAENDEDKLVYRDTLTNLSAEIDAKQGWQKYYNAYLDFIKRGIRIGDYIYTISDKYITSYDLGNLHEIQELEI